MAKLYQTVSRATLIEVYKKYKYDYELFGFDFNKVLKLAGYHTLTKYEETLEPGFYKTKNFEGYSSWHKLTVIISMQSKEALENNWKKQTPTTNHFHPFSEDIVILKRFEAKF